MPLSPSRMQGGWGRIINTGSMHALVASPYKSAYNAAKHGVAWGEMIRWEMRMEEMPREDRELLD